MAKPFRTTLSLLSLLVATISAHAAPTEITLPGTRVFPESITSTKDGTLIVGSVGKGNVSRIDPGSTKVEEWIKPGANGLGQVFGVYADEPHKTLWVCSDSYSAHGATIAVKSFDLTTGAPRGSYPLPGGNAFCNDIAVAPNGTAYISDTGQASIYLLRPGATALETAAKDRLLDSIDGLAFGDAFTLYVNDFGSGKLLRVQLGQDGKSTKITDLKLSRHLDRPDGMRTLGQNSFLLAENSGDISVITINGDNAKVETIKHGLDHTAAVTATRGSAWIAETKLNYMDDPKLKDKDPGPFKLYAVPLPGK